MTIVNLPFLFISPVADVVFLYLGPETFMPLLSFLAAVGGVLLMFGRRIMVLLRKFFGFCRNLMSR